MLVEDLNDQISRLAQGLNMRMCMQLKGQSSCHQMQNEREKQKKKWPVFIALSSIIINVNYSTIDFLVLFL
jgi:hypothetical protein